MAALQAAVNDDRPSQVSDAPVTRNLAADPAIVARRARLRRIVAYVLLPAAVVAVIAGAKLASNTDATASSASGNTTVSAPATLRPLTTNASRTATPATTRPPVPEIPVPVASVSATPEPSASVAAAPEDAPAAASSAPAQEEPPAEAAADVAALKKQALKLLNQGKMREALPVAQSALAADPSDANLYLYVGSALEELGRRKEAIEVYSRCVHEATKGPKYECRAVGGK